MATISSAVDHRAVEKLREEELEEARAIQRVMLPVDVLCSGPVTIAHKFQPLDLVGGDFLDYFELPDGTIGFSLGMSPVRDRLRPGTRLWRSEYCAEYT